jgi:glycosyltransferase involved in cell wall biosynthesis
MPYRKGADLFIEVAKRVHDQGRTNFHFYWIGDLEIKPGAEADHFANLRRSAEGYVSFLGTKNDPGPFLQAADIFLLPSREDPFPLVALEAAACSLPIICFEKAGGMPDFVEQDAGCTVAFEDLESMARKVIALMDDKQLRRTFGLRARQKLLTNCTIERTGPQILTVCRDVARRKPAVSVIVPNFNHGRYLRKRLDSIFDQTFKDFEVILLDDHSTDDSLQILQQYLGEPNVRLVQNERNSGSTFQQWLKGIDLARADVIWLAESDDACEPEFVETLLPVLREEQVKLAYANSNVMDENDLVVGDYTTCEYLTSLSATKWTVSYRAAAEQEINDGLGVKNTILSASSVMFKRFEFEPGARRVLESLRMTGDWYFFIHAIADGEVYYDARKLNYHRRHSESVIGKLLKQNRVEEFFREFHIVQSAIVDKYPLRNRFLEKWKEYLEVQWNAFFPGRSFGDLCAYYPFKEMARRIDGGLPFSEAASTLVGAD